MTSGLKLESGKSEPHLPARRLAQQRIGDVDAHERVAASLADRDPERRRGKIRRASDSSFSGCATITVVASLPMAPAKRLSEGSSASLSSRRRRA